MGDERDDPRRLTAHAPDVLVEQLLELPGKTAGLDRPPPADADHVGEAVLQILQKAPPAQLVDLEHEIPLQRLEDLGVLRVRQFLEVLRSLKSNWLLSGSYSMTPRLVTGRSGRASSTNRYSALALVASSGISPRYGSTVRSQWFTVQTENSPGAPGS